MRQEIIKPTPERVTGVKSVTTSIDQLFPGFKDDKLLPLSKADLTIHSQRRGDTSRYLAILDYPFRSTDLELLLSSVSSASTNRDSISENWRRREAEGEEGLIFNNFSETLANLMGQVDDSMALRLLARRCFTMDQARNFISRNQSFARSLRRTYLEHDLSYDLATFVNGIATEMRQRGDVWRSKNNYNKATVQRVVNRLSQLSEDARGEIVNSFFNSLSDEEREEMVRKRVVAYNGVVFSDAFGNQAFIVPLQGERINEPRRGKIEIIGQVVHADVEIKNQGEDIDITTQGKNYRIPMIAWESSRRGRARKWLTKVDQITSGQIVLNSENPKVRILQPYEGKDLDPILGLLVGEYVSIRTDEEDSLNSEAENVPLAVIGKRKEILNSTFTLRMEEISS